MKKHFIFCAALALVALVAACEKPETDPLNPDVVKVQSVAIRQEGNGSYVRELNLTMKERQVVTLEKQVTPGNATESVTFKSDNTMIARVSRKGVITARSEGNTDIRIVAGGTEMAVCHLTVEKNDVIVEAFGTDTEAIEMDWGKTTHVFVNNVTPSGIAIGDTYFSFVSSNEDVFTVETEYDGFGCMVNGIAPGEGTLTVSIDGLTKVIPVKINKRVLNVRTSWVESVPADHYRKEYLPASDEIYTQFREGYVNLYAGFRTYLYLVDKEGNHVHGKYGFRDYANSYANYQFAEWQILDDSGIYVTPRKDASNRYDGLSYRVLSFESDLYEFDPKSYLSGSPDLPVRTRCAGFMSFVDGLGIDICRNSGSPSSALTQDARYYSGSFHAKVGESIEVFVSIPGMEQRGFNDQVAFLPNGECSEQWFEYKSEKGLFKVTDIDPGTNENGDPQRLSFIAAGTDTFTVKDKFGHSRSVNFTITW